MYDNNITFDCMIIDIFCLLNFCKLLTCVNVRLKLVAAAVDVCFVKLKLTSVLLWCTMYAM